MIAMSEPLGYPVKDHRKTTRPLGYPSELEITAEEHREVPRHTIDGRDIETLEVGATRPVGDDHDDASGEDDAGDGDPDSHRPGSMGEPNVSRETSADEQAGMSGKDSGQTPADSSPSIQPAAPIGVVPGNDVPLVSRETLSAVGDGQSSAGAHHSDIEPRGSRDAVGSGMASDEETHDVSRETSMADDSDSSAGSSPRPDGSRAASGRVEQNDSAVGLTNDVDPAVDVSRETSEEGEALTGSNDPAAPRPLRNPAARHPAPRPPEEPRHRPERALYEEPLSLETMNVSRETRVKTVPLPHLDAPRRIVIANQKGGVGKTTTSVNLAVALAQGGLNVLVVDVDPQGNASTALGIPHQEGVRGSYELLLDEVPVADLVVDSPEAKGLKVVPATIDLAGAELELVSKVAREQRLSRAIRDYEADHDVDFVIFDCPPSLGLLTVNALVAASDILIPIQSEYYALEGVQQLMRTISLVKRQLNSDLELWAVLVTMYDARTRLSAQVAEEVMAHFPKETLHTMIPRSVRISEAPSYGQSVLNYDPNSVGSNAYRKVAQELSQRAMKEQE
ncbi:Chromosome partitioning protein [Propionibacterium freudenreichii]|nr:Chromosome partitioning protein [Propionibacterium freudenreichii]